MMKVGFAQLRLDVLGQQVVDELRPVAAGSSSMPFSRRGHESVAVAAAEHVDAGLLPDRVAQGHAPPRRGEVDLARRSRSRAATNDDQLLELGRDVVVVGVGLVPLEHRELGVVLGREALVAEVLAELVDPLEAADDQALEVQLGGDPQVEVAVERVVVGGEGPRQRAAVERLEHRRLDLEEAALVEPAPRSRRPPSSAG